MSDVGKAADGFRCERFAEWGGARTGGVSTRRLTHAAEIVRAKRPGDLRSAGAKRLLDLVLSLLLLIGLLPVIALLALAVKVESRGPIFYRCRRVGLGGCEFRMLKFRKMHRNATGPMLTAANDKRFTRLGSFLARTKLDELPQFWNVIRGDMSLVGPRPEDSSFVAFDPRGYVETLKIRPGITGLSQLAYVRESELLNGPDPVRSYVESVLPQKIAIDRLYVARRTISLDARILFWTIAAIFGVEVSIDSTSSRVSIRRLRSSADESASTLSEEMAA